MHIIRYRFVALHWATELLAISAFTFNIILNNFMLAMLYSHADVLILMRLSYLVGCWCYRGKRSPTKRIMISACFCSAIDDGEYANAHNHTDHNTAPCFYVYAKHGVVSGWCCCWLPMGRLYSQSGRTDRLGGTRDFGFLDAIELNSVVVLCYLDLHGLPVLLI